MNYTKRADLRPAAADLIPAQLLNDLVGDGGFGWPICGDLTTLEYGTWQDPDFARTDPKPARGIASGRLSPIDAGTASLGVLWNLDAADLNHKVRTGTLAPVAVDGDGHLRSRAALIASTEAMNTAWAQSRAEHFATDRTADRRRDEARDRYREAREALSGSGTRRGHIDLADALRDAHADLSRSKTGRTA